MDLNVREVARLLELPERSVRKMAEEGTLPCYHVQDQLRFNRVELQEWARATRRKVSPELFAVVDKAAPSLAAAIERGGVHARVAGDSPAEVLANVAALPTVPPGVDRALLRELLVGREALASTGIGNGIALPHARDPLVVPSDAPIVIVAYLAQPVDFKAIDGHPVRVLFTLLSPTIRAHLQLLSRLMYVLHDDPLRRLLDDRAPADAVVARVRALEEGASAQ